MTCAAAGDATGYPARIARLARLRDGRHFPRRELGERPGPPREREHQQVRCAAPGQQARIGGVGAARPRGRRLDHPGERAHDQGQRQPRAPSAAQFSAEEHPSSGQCPTPHIPVTARPGTTVGIEASSPGDLTRDCLSLGHGAGTAGKGGSTTPAVVLTAPALTRDHPVEPRAESLRSAQGAQPRSAHGGCGPQGGEAGAARIEARAAPRGARVPDPVAGLGRAGPAGRGRGGRCPGRRRGGAADQQRLPALPARLARLRPAGLGGRNRDDRLLRRAGPAAGRGAGRAGHRPERAAR